MDKLLVLVYNLVDQDYKILALHRIFSTLYDKQIESHERDLIDRLVSNEKDKQMFDFKEEKIDEQNETKVKAFLTNKPG